MCQDPDRPSLESRHMRFFCIGFRYGNNVAICINLYLRGCIVHFRKYGLPYGLSVSLCTLHLMVTHFNATLGMGDWLDLTQQGLSPCKKYKTSWRSPVKSYRIIDLAHLPIYYLLSFLNFHDFIISPCGNCFNSRCRSIFLAAFKINPLSLLFTKL